jgi:hypothetical protein
VRIDIYRGKSEFKIMPKDQIVSVDAPIEGERESRFFKRRKSKEFGLQLCASQSASRHGIQKSVQTLIGDIVKSCVSETGASLLK